jgi:hypothetical protein
MPVSFFLLYLFIFFPYSQEIWISLVRLDVTNLGPHIQFGLTAKQIQ